MSKIELGKKAPAFSLEGTSGAWSSKDAAGGTLVVYFYPKDNTTGCTQEGQEFAALHAQFKKAKAIVVGVSPDSLASHDKFRTKMGFPFDLLADPEKKVCNLFEVYKEKSMYGRKYMGVERSTFVIDDKGVLRHEWRKVKVKGHAEAVLAAVKSL